MGWVVPWHAREHSSCERGWMSADVDVSGDLVGYEQDRVAQVRTWHGRSPGLADRLLSSVSDRVRWVTDRLRRTVRRRSVAVVPVLGAAASASASGWLVSRVSEAARHTGAVRFLHAHAQVPVGALLGEPDQVAVT